MDALDIEKWRFISQSPGKSVGISSVLLGFILVGRATFVFPSLILIQFASEIPTCHNLVVWSYARCCFYSTCLQPGEFTRLGHTTLRENAIMITSTISVVLFSTVVRH
ncbi:hypothetical protein AHAS_Ahas15G0325800 [Arachis hypogaea]